MKAFVCSKCGAENSISRLVVVEGWEGITVTPGEDGKPVETKTGEREVEWIFAELENYHCAECDQRKAALVDAVVAEAAAEAECRECGFAGDPAEHASTCPGELLGLEPPEVHPQQTTLVADERVGVAA